MKSFVQYLSEAESLSSLGGIMSLKTGDWIKDNKTGKEFVIFSKEKEGESLLVPVENGKIADYVVSFNWYDWVGNQGVTLLKSGVTLNLPQPLKFKQA